MCNHQPILVYDTGGTCYVCANCGIVLGDWEQNMKKPKYQREEQFPALEVQPLMFKEED